MSLYFDEERKTKKTSETQESTLRDAIRKE